MKSIKQQFIELKNSTPKHIQWILLGAAFVVVIILLVLLLGNKSNTTSENKANENISFDVEPETIQLNEVEVGKSLSKSINITVSAPVVIKSIDVDVDVRGVDCYFRTFLVAGRSTNSSHFVAIHWKPFNV